MLYNNQILLVRQYIEDLTDDEFNSLFSLDIEAKDKFASFLLEISSMNETTARDTVNQLLSTIDSSINGNINENKKELIYNNIEKLKIIYKK